MPIITNQRVRLLGGARKWWLAGGAPVPVAVYQPKGAASLAASYVNLARTDGTYNAAPGVAPTFAAATGWTFDGLTQYLFAGGIVPTQTYSAIIRFSNLTGTSTYLFGALRGASGFRITANLSNTQVRYVNGTQVGAIPQLLGGVLAIAGVNGYRNGAVDVSTLSASFASMHQIMIGAFNNDSASGSPSSFAACKIQAFAIYSSVLTPSQVASVSAAMAAL